MEIIGATFERLNADIEAFTSDAVKIWMNWMVGIFLASVFFVWQHKTARWALTAFVAGVPLTLLVYWRTQEIYYLGIVHIVCWGLLPQYIWRYNFKSPDFRFASAYGVWVSLLFTTIIISLTLDVRDLFLVQMNYE